jgi:site-specific DNA-cytosine methylase
MGDVKMHRVLTINTYAGSLLLGAKMAGSEVIASLEDSRFGVECQERNFPDLKIHVGSWPSMDLSDVSVIAHPPCSAFSTLTLGGKNKGTGSDAFKCTINAIEYAGKNGAKDLAIESVMKAAEGARELHESMAKKYGWNIFRIFQNSVTFGVPQWRNRFWVIFSKSKQLVIRHRPVIKRLKEVLDDVPGIEDKAFKRQSDILIEHGFDPSKIYTQPPWGHLRKSLGVPIEKLKELMWTKFSVNQFVKLDPDNFAPVVVGSANWLWKGKPLSLENWKRIMGFPPDYWMPDKKVRTYLSKGVCPQVASWVIRILQEPGDELLNPGEIIDLRPSKGAYIQH